MSEEYEAQEEEFDATDELFQQFIESELPPKAAVAREEAGQEEEPREVVEEQEDESSVEEEVAPEVEEDVEPPEEVEVPPVPAPAEPSQKVAPSAEVNALREALAYTQQQLQAAMAERAKQQPMQPAVTPIEFLKDDDAYGEALSSKESFNALLNEVYTQAFAKAREMVLREVPTVVTPAIQQEITKTTMLENWRRNNTDLLDKMDYVSMVAQQLAAEHQADPAWGWPEFFRELGPAVRKRLGMPASAANAATKRPAFANAPKAARKPTPKEVSEAEKQLAWLFSNDEE